MTLLLLFWSCLSLIVASVVVVDVFVVDFGGLVNSFGAAEMNIIYTLKTVQALEWVLKYNILLKMLTKFWND